jgi:hypothetical protein
MICSIAYLIGDNAGEGNYGERYRDREREGMRESVGEGKRGRGRESERERGRCNFLIPLHDKSSTNQVEV